VTTTDKDLPHVQHGIMLPASVLGVLKGVPAGALKVFIYLCSRYQGQPFAATIPTITDATGIQQRSVIAALKTLEEQKLITRIPGSGNQPNQYGIPFPKRQETAAPPSPELRQAPPPAATTPTQVATHTNPPPSTKSNAAPSPSPTPATIMECVAVCYRRINAQEFGQLKQAIPDEGVLRKALVKLNDNGGVDPEIALGFFLRVLTEFA
jgi:DNA-binding transcriptional MocR family regulator